MNLLRPTIASLIIALASFNVLADDDGAIDPAPSGNEQTHTSVGETGAVSGPGSNYDNGTGGATSTSHDFSGWQPSSEDNTTIDYSGSSDSSNSSDSSDSSGQ